MQKFSERINSAANKVITKEIVKTGPKFLDMLVTLQMNENSMTFIKDHKYKGNINLIAGLQEMNEGLINHLLMEFDTS